MKSHPALLALVFAGAAQANVLAAQPTATKPSPRSADEKAIQAATAAFVTAYNAGDVKALAALFTADAEAVDEEGKVLRGRAAIVDQFAQVFANDPGSKITVRADSLHFIGTDVAKEEGHSSIAPGGGGPPE